MMKTINKIREITGQVSQKHVGAYAAQSAYFFVLSMIPIILLLLAIIQYTPVTKADVMTAVVNLFPETNMQDFMVGIVNEVYNQSKTVIPITAIVALWSAGKGSYRWMLGFLKIHNFVSHEAHMHSSVLY